MDITTLEHFSIAFIITFIGWLTGDIYAGAALSIGIFLGREHSQAEYRGIEGYYDGFRGAAPWGVGFQFRNWNWHSVLDVVAPIVGAGLVVLIYYGCRHSW